MTEALRGGRGEFRVIAIAQVHNEMRKGNLERFFDHLQPLVDEIVIYDDGSTDGSFEFAQARTEYLIRGTRNDFADEIAHKQLLLEQAGGLSPDFILWLDADEVLGTDGAGALQELCAWAVAEGADGVALPEYNLWQSTAWRRTDSMFGDASFVRLWRWSPDLRFESRERGLHQTQFPSSLRRIRQYPDLPVLHFGFADERNRAFKYLTYRAHGQRGYDMLDRLISEERLTVQRVPDSFVPTDLRADNAAPEPRPFSVALERVEQWREEVRRPAFSIVCLIYKSVEWAQFVYEQVLRYTDMSDKEFFFVANDATPEVLAYLKRNYIPHHVWDNTPEQRTGWYINNVYRAWNYGASKANGDFIVFVNSDMAFSPGWLDVLWESYDGASAVASRLVESGKLESGLYGIEKDFGSTPHDYRERDFQEFAESVRDQIVVDGGLFMPLLVRRDLFLSVGGYPEGNIRPGSDIFDPDIALQGEPCVSGDVVLMQRLATRGVTHRTACDSVIYHFQMGEMDSKPSDPGADQAPRVAICNDLVTGTMGERVLWDFLLEGLPASIGIDERVVGKGDFARLAREHLRIAHPDLPVIVPNVTFIDLVDPERNTIGFLQDNLRAMGRDSSQQDANLKAAHTRVTNSVLTTISYPEFEFEIIPVGVDEELFRPLDKTACRTAHSIPDGQVGIFVGAFDEVKGWSAVRACIEAYPEITWILVTKRDESVQAPNVRVYSRIPQETLVELLNCADFFILGSPVETQCLAAIEACLCDVPLVMRNTGVFSGLSDEIRAGAGYFGDDLRAGVFEVLRGTYTPRTLAISQGWTVGSSVAKWQRLIESAMQEVVAERVGFVAPAGSDGRSEVVRRRARNTGYAPIPRRRSKWRGRRRFLSPLLYVRKIREYGVSRSLSIGIQKLKKAALQRD